jgi:superfamily II DNA/RNA helicase
MLAPTRELADQIYQNVAAYAKHTPLRCAVVFGGVDMKPQTLALRQGCEILIATPGRLLDHVEQKTTNLGQVQILVLDEADRMLDMGFLPDIQRIINLLNKDRQNLMFSATFSGEIRKLAEKNRAEAFGFYTAAICFCQENRTDGFIAEDELVEVTPSNVRIRKRILKEQDRRRLKRRLTLWRVLAVLEGIQASFNAQAGGAKRVSLADLIVLACKTDVNGGAHGISLIALRGLALASSTTTRA